LLKGKAKLARQGNACLAKQTFAGD